MSSHGKPRLKRAVVLWAALLLIILGSLAGIRALPRHRPEPEPERTTGFRNALDAAITELSAEDGRSYVLDGQSYNEYRARTYVEVMSGTGDISPDLIREYFWQIFVPDGDSLVEKDSRSMVLDCPDGGRMDILDCKFIGLVNNEVVDRSKGLYISQNDAAYEKLAYGTSNVRWSGCGPACLAMGVNYVRGERYLTMEDVVGWANEHGMYVPGAGTSWELMRQFPSAAGMKCTELYIDRPEKLNGAVSEGEVLITSMHKGHFTNNGHFIVITSAEDGTVRVLDPACVCRSTVDWDAAVIVGESNKYFWKISMPGE